MTIAQRQMISNYVLGTMKLRVETGRFENVPRENRVCKIDGKLENQYHVMSECVLHKGLREQFNIEPNSESEIVDLFSKPFKLSKFLNRLMHEREL